MKNKFFLALFLFIISLGLVFDLFINIGQPVTFDGPTHITNIAMFYKSLKEGIFPVSWTDGFANYGMPLGLMAQQTTSYLGAFLNFLVKDPLFSYNLVLLIGALLSNLIFYLFLREYFPISLSLLATFIFNLAPYRIINIYIRGALPEFFASIFLPLILLAVKKFIERGQFFYFFLISFSYGLLILTHPFMIIIYSFPIIIFTFFSLLSKRENFKLNIIYLFFAFLLGIFLSFYFIFPLSAELKYFYYGQAKNHFNQGHFLSWENFFNPSWFYFYKNDIGPRGHFMTTGALEIFFIIIFWFLFILKNKFNKKNIPLAKLVFYSSIIYILFLIPASNFLYQTFSFLGNIQHPWRMLSGFIFLPPIALCFLIEELFFKKKTLKSYYHLPIYFLLILIAFFRIPQLYGKNYKLVSPNDYFFTKENLHAVVLNTIWSGKSEDYPVKKIKGEIIEGKGRLEAIVVKNNFREYLLLAQTPVRLADYTFYFPGWRVYVDGQKVPIEFQDPNYRGVITYKVSSGQHKILVKFEETKVRILGKIVSFFSIICLIFLYVKRKKFFAS